MNSIIEKYMPYVIGTILGQLLLWLVFHQVGRNVFALVFTIAVVAVYEGIIKPFRQLNER